MGHFRNRSGDDPVGITLDVSGGASSNTAIHIINGGIKIGNREGFTGNGQYNWFEIRNGIIVGATS